MERSQGSTERIRQNRLAAKLRRNRAPARSNLIQCFIPGNSQPDWRGGFLCGDPRPRLPMGSEAPLPGPRPLGPNPPHGIQNPIRRIHPIQILRHLGTQKPACNRMLWIALNLRGPSILDGNQHAASVRTIMGTRGMDELVHELRLYGASPAGGGVASGKFINAKKKRKKEKPTAVRPSPGSWPKPFVALRRRYPPTRHQLPDCRLPDPSAIERQPSTVALKVEY